MGNGIVGHGVHGDAEYLSVAHNTKIFNLHWVTPTHEAVGGIDLFVWKYGHRLGIFHHCSLPWCQHFAIG